MLERESQKDTRIAIIIHRTPESTYEGHFIKHELNAKETIVFFKDGTVKKVLKKDTEHEDNPDFKDENIHELINKMEIAFAFGEASLQLNSFAPEDSKTKKFEVNNALVVYERGRNRFETYGGYDSDDVIDALDRYRDKRDHKLFHVN